MIGTPYAPPARRKTKPSTTRFYPADPRARLADSISQVLAPSPMTPLSGQTRSPSSALPPTSAPLTQTFHLICWAQPSGLLLCSFLLLSLLPVIYFDEVLREFCLLPSLHRRISRHAGHFSQ